MKLFQLFPSSLFGHVTYGIDSQVPGIQEWTSLHRCYTTVNYSPDSK